MPGHVGIPTGYGYAIQCPAEGCAEPNLVWIGGYADINHSQALPDPNVGVITLQRYMCSLSAHLAKKIYIQCILWVRTFVMSLSRLETVTHHLTYRDSKDGEQ